MLFTHAEAFADQAGAYAAMRAAFPALEVVEVPTEAVSLAEAIRTYLFNAQLVTLPAGGMGLILGRRAFQRPFADGVKLLNAVQDVYLASEITVA